ncbi:MAG: hypothetical protein E7299_02675 [Lachnospiraceae bacterium]|nr:hypothetical protein [Lachnospiraceae bacterium]
MTVYETRYGKIWYRDYKNGIEICAYQGTDIGLDMHEVENATDKKLISIGKKAFLSAKTVKALVLTASVEEIGDWAFAYCMNLEEIQFLSKHIRWGKELFKGCTKLRNVAVSKQIPGELLAAGLAVMKIQSLLQISEVEQWWYQKFDEALLDFILMDDREGLVGNVVGGEEEYGTQESDIQLFMHEKRMEKVRVTYLRLLYPSYLKAETKDRLENYLRTHTMGEQHAEAWQVLLDMNDTRYGEVFLQAGCFHQSNYQMLLEELAAGHPEMTAMFLRYQSDMQKKEDFFDVLNDF